MAFLDHLVKKFDSIQFKVEELKNIPIYNLFYCVALDIIGPLLETKVGNKYILVAIDHYSKWCEAKLIKQHIAMIVVKFLEDEIICRFGVPKYFLINNSGEWMA
jgi:hypothetical protein